MNTSVKNSGKSGKIGLDTVISWGATVVIIGLTFKLLHWQGGEWMIAIGLITEAFLFFILGLSYINKPAATVSSAPAPAAMSQDLDNLLNTSINPRTVERLSRGFENLNQTVEAINQASGYTQVSQKMIDELVSATKEVQDMRKNLADLNNIYKAQLEAFRK